MNDHINDRDIEHAGSEPVNDEEASRTGTVFWAALVGGSLIASGAFLALGLNFGSPPVSILVICAGLSIVLGAFGSAATLRFQGVTVAGVAAVCMVLFYFVSDDIRKSAVKIDISGIARGADVDFFSSAGQQIFGAPRGKSYQFIAFADDLDSKVLSLGIFMAAVPDTSEEREIPFDCVPRSAIDRFIGSGETLRWRVDMANGELWTHDDPPALIAQSGPCRKKGDKASSMRWPQLMSTAHAQTPPTKGIAQSLRELNSESSALRRDARKALAAHGPEGVRPIMQQWANEKNSYRIRLGSAVALAEMLRDRKTERTIVSAQLSENDLKLVAQSLSDEDRTVRIYASEFLTDLGDKRLASIALEQLPVASADGQYNLALVLESVATELSPAERETLRAQLTTLRANGNVRLGPRTEEKLEAVANQAAVDVRSAGG